MSDIEDIAETLPNLKSDPAENGRCRAGKAYVRRVSSDYRDQVKAASESGNRLRMSVHQPSLPKLKFMGDV